MKRVWLLFIVLAACDPGDEEDLDLLEEDEPVDTTTVAASGLFEGVNGH